LCFALAAATLAVGLLTAKLCSRNAAHAEYLHRLHQENEMRAAYNELLAAEVEGHVPGGVETAEELFEQ
jgi:hypothetical protein